MDHDTVIETLIDFFQDSLKDDPLGTGDWLAQGGVDADAFVYAIRKLRIPKE